MNAVTTLISAFTRFPGVGRKSAKRMVYHLLKKNPAELRRLGALIASLKDGLYTCSECGNISGSNPCPICRNTMRDREILCVVEDVEDLASFEQAGIYKGLYHVLGGRVSPYDDETLSDDTIRALLSRVVRLNVREVIIATNPRMEGDLTYYTLLEAFKSDKNLRSDVRISRLAYGLPVGGSIEFADRMTLHTALESRVTASLEGRPRGTP